MDRNFTPPPPPPPPYGYTMGSCKENIPQKKKKKNFKLQRKDREKSFFNVLHSFEMRTFPVEGACFLVRDGVQNIWSSESEGRDLKAKVTNLVLIKRSIYEFLYVLVCRYLEMTNYKLPPVNCVYQFCLFVCLFVRLIDWLIVSSKICLFFYFD